MSALKLLVLFDSECLRWIEYAKRKKEVRFEEQVYFYRAGDVVGIKSMGQRIHIWPAASYI